MFLKVSHNDEVSTFEKVFWFVGFLFFFTSLKTVSLIRKKTGPQPIEVSQHP